MKKTTKPHEPTASEVAHFSEDDAQSLFADGEVTITTEPVFSIEDSAPQGAPATTEIVAADRFPSAKVPTPETDPDLFDFAGNRL